MVELLKPSLISVSIFSSPTPVIKGTDRITKQLAAMKPGLLKELDTAPLPLKTKT